MESVTKRRVLAATPAMTSATKLLALLELIGASPGPVRVSDLARQAGASRAEVHRQLVTLLKAGWLEQDERGAYRLTLKAVSLGAAAARQAGFGPRLLPVMERLVDAVHEVASLAILDGDAARIIQRVEPGRALRADLRVGARLPLAQSASGRVLLAFGDPAVVQRLRADGLALPSDRELEAIRAAGFAHSIDDEVDELSAMAVPVHNWERAYVAALSVVGPAGRFDHEASKQALLAAAEEIDRLVVAEPETTVVRMRREME